MVDLSKSRWRWVIITIVLLLAVAAAVVGSFTPNPGVTLTDLNNVADLRDQFNRDAGKVRVLLLLAPT